MKKALIPAVIVAVLAGGFIALRSILATDSLAWGKELNPGKCVKAGKLVIEATEKVEKSVDSGIAGNFWAFDDYTRHFQVWEQEGGTYCAIVKYEGKFDSQSGQTSPGAGGTLDGSEDGSFEGGYRATIAGSLRTNPGWKTKGNVGTTKYNCDISGTCPGRVDWVGQYFNAGYSFAFDWWGWIYHGGNAGTWVNASEGNSGDIL